METSLHRQLKDRYATCGAQTEVCLGQYRIDVVRRKELIEIQHGSLAAIRDKVRRLCADHRVRVVKPIVARKQLIKLDGPDGEVVSRRRSPKRGKLLDLFDELVYFTRTFPHPNLLIETMLVEVEEWRYPGHGRRRRHRETDFRVQDVKLTSVGKVHRFRTAAQLAALLPKRLPDPFHSGHVAARLDVDRWIAQRVLYCLRKMGGITQAGKRGNALLYQMSDAITDAA